jgi:hypothetical protein
MSLSFIVQHESHRYSDLFRTALRGGEFDAIDAAVAYATVGGVTALTNLFDELLRDAWDRMSKRWLVGIDWCRADPPALRMLAELSQSEVRVPDGANIVRRPGCPPTVTFHPKLFLLGGRGVVAVVSGSGNLSASGMLRGCECGSVFIRRKETEERTELKAQPDVAGLRGWFVGAWAHATPYRDIAESYEQACRKRAREGMLTPTDDASGGVHPRGLNAIQLQQPRTFENIWIDAGALGANLGRGKPGNQLDMRRFTRVFFGGAAEDLPPETPIDKLTLIWDGESHPDRTLKYGDNGMDKLNIPPVGDRGDMFYARKTLLFTRVAPRVFEFRVGDDSDKRKWHHESRLRGVLMPRISQREWGLF